jgi:hypothetical protein
VLGVATSFEAGVNAPGYSASCKESRDLTTNLQNNKRDHNANHATRSNESSEAENAARADFW